MKKNDIKVSVVMPSLNVQPYIRECIESVLAQTLTEIEVICVDAGSTDGTLEILQEYAAQDSRVQVYISDKKSYGYQINLGMDKARGKYLAIVETDDMVSPGMYRTLYRIATKNRLDFVKGDFYIFTGDAGHRSADYIPIAPDNMYLRILDPRMDPSVLKDGSTMFTWAGIYNLSFLRKNQIRHHETPGASYQDNGFWFQVYTHARRAQFIPHAFYCLRRDNPSSSCFSKQKVFCMCDEYDFIRENLRKDPELDLRFAALCALHRFHVYNFTLGRIDESSMEMFLSRYAKDFQKIEADGELQQELFTPAQWSTLREIMQNPTQFYAEHYPLDIFTLLSAKEKELSPPVTRKANPIMRCVGSLRKNGLYRSFLLADVKLKKRIYRKIPNVFS